MIATDNKRQITREQLMSALSYNAGTGDFVWSRRISSCVKIGASAGYITFENYKYISVYGRKYAAHRLAWLYMTGEWPSTDIDHIDGNPSNNKWDNLRAATGSQNNANSRTPRHNTSGIKGVSKCGNKWKAYINYDRKQIHLGMFATKEEARSAYTAAAIMLYGNFARVS